MARSSQTKNPGEVLQSFIDEYQTNAFALSKSIKVAYQSVTNILNGKGRISVHIALRLGQYFGNTPKYWLDVQASYEIDELSADKKFVNSIKSIPKAVKPSGKVKKEIKNKGDTLAEKRKNAAKLPGAKQARGKKPGKSKKK
ncbi:MAG: HigA family addiction module antitoxin [Treponema sp.]|nr:HigA family addiction module antitoxin [Treponema sp.]